MATVRLITGPTRSDRPLRIDRIMGEHWGQSLLLAPTRAYAARRRERLILDYERRGAWGNPVQQFTDFASRLLEGEGVSVRRLGDFERRLMLERCLDDLDQTGKLGEFAAAQSRPGLVTHLLRIITQLKQGAIEAAAFRERLARAGTASALDAVVSDAYAAYQDALLAAGAYDVPGLYWEAALRCTRGRPRALEGISVLLLDGFDDFTPSEFRLLESVEHHVDRLIFGVNYDADPGRKDLYAIPAATVDSIQKRFEVTVEEAETPAPKRCSEYASRTIFWRSPPRCPEGLESDVTVLACAGRNHEIETIGRRVKGLVLDEGVPPDTIAIVFRDIGEVATTLRAVLHEFGIPMRTTHKPSTAGSAIASFLLRFFEATETWGREVVLDVLLAPWFPGPEQETRLLFPVLARSAQVISGYDEWRRRIEGLIARTTAPAPNDPQIQPTAYSLQPLMDRIPGLREAAETLLAQVASLKEFADALPQRASQAVFAEAFDGLLDKLGIEATLDALGDNGIAHTERNALAAVRGLLAVLARADTGERLTRRAFLERFTRGLHETSFAWPDAGPGVLCCDPASVRNLEVDYIFFGGLIEGVTPCPPATNAVYSDRDLERLRRAGIALEDKRRHADGERLLFCHVLEAAGKGLTLSWSLAKRGDAAASQSPFLRELRNLFAEGALEEGPAPQSDSFVPAHNRIASLRDLRNTAFYRHPGIRNALPREFTAVEAGVEMEERRRGRGPFDVYDGVLADTVLIDTIASHYAEAYPFSVSQLETYIDCPFKYFAGRLLEVQETAQPDAEFDPRARGRILHRVLQAFHRHYRGRTMDELPEEEALETLRRIVGKIFEEERRRGAAMAPGVLEVERSRMAVTLERYLHIETGRDEAAWRPEHFEPAFGPVRGAVEDPLSTPEPFVLDTEAGPVRFSGQIDRVDLAGGEARLMDYKSSILPEAKDIASGRSIQLTVYAWALERLLMEGTQCVEAWFTIPGKAKRQSALKVRNASKAEREENVLGNIVTAVRGIRAGAFPPAPPDPKHACAYCAYRAACRYEEARIERKRGAAGTANDVY